MENIHIDVLYIIFNYIGIYETFSFRIISKNWFNIIYKLNPKHINPKYLTWDSFKDENKLKWSYRYKKNLNLKIIDFSYDGIKDIGYFQETDSFWIETSNFLYIQKNLTDKIYERIYDLRLSIILMRGLEPRNCFYIKEFIRIDEKTGNELKKSKFIIDEYFFTDNLILFVKNDLLYFIHNDDWIGKNNEYINENDIFSEKRNIGKYDNNGYIENKYIVKNHKNKIYFDEKSMKQIIPSYNTLYFGKIFGEFGKIDIDLDSKNLILYINHGKGYKISKSFHFDLEQKITYNKNNVYDKYYIPSRHTKYLINIISYDNLLFIHFKVTYNPICPETRWYENCYYRITKKDYEKDLYFERIDKKIDQNNILEIPKDKIEKHCLTKSEFIKIDEINSKILIYSTL
jgi:hypothetical protein